MANLEERIFGYHKGKVAPEDSSKLVNTLLRTEICSTVTPDGDFYLHRRDKSRFLSYTRGRMRFDLSDLLGLRGVMIRCSKRYGLLLALVTSLVFFVFSSGLVWDIRVSGNDRLTDYEIENALDDLGFGVGSRWSRLDKNAIENELLRSNPDIAWISVNRRGTVAYVEVIESENIGLEEDDGYPFSNVIADRDGVIEEITVHSGVAVVNVGDVVHKGEVLISGVIENESGVTFTRARGTIRASSVVDVVAEAPQEAIEKTVKARKLAELRIILFNFSINIFKNYRNCENSCDIIKENRKIALFCKYRLPIRLEKTYATEYTEVQRTRSHDEMTEIAKRDLNNKMYSMFKDADVTKIRTYGEFVDGVYRITSRVVYSTDIGDESAIEIS